MDDIKHNIAHLQTKLAQYPNAKLLAVSKKQSAEYIKEAYTFGQIHFGENYVQEALAKIEILKDLKIIWHFIGRIQKNKLNKIVGVFEYIHSVDDIEVLDKISELAHEKNITQKIFLQVNQGSEETKGGFEEEFLLQNWSSIASTKNVQICGLMTLPPLSEDEFETLQYFKQLKNLMQKLKTQNDLPTFKELSMGTSSDYKLALKEGATWIRLGTSIFGARP